MTAESEGRVRLTVNQAEVLINARSADDYGPGRWWRPMDLGGFDTSHHSATAAALAKKGLLERLDRGSLAGVRAVWNYRITPAGRRALETSHDK